MLISTSHSWLADLDQKLKFSFSWYSLLSTTLHYYLLFTAMETVVKVNTHIRYEIKMCIKILQKNLTLHWPLKFYLNCFAYNRFYVQEKNIFF